MLQGLWFPAKFAAGGMLILIIYGQSHSVGMALFASILTTIAMVSP